MKRARQIPRRGIAAIVVALTASGSAAAFALAGTSTGDHDSQKPAVVTIQQVPPAVAAKFPVLEKALGPSEAVQLPAVAHAVSNLERYADLASSAGANSELARRISDTGEDAEYLVPGREVLCMVSITAGHPSGAGCAPETSIETTGTTSLTVVPGGYEVSGILPIGTGNVWITDVNGHTTTVATNANHAFQYFSAMALSHLAYDLPGGGQHVGSLAMPPPPTSPVPQEG